MTGLARPSVGTIALQAAYWAFVLYLFLPLLVMIAMSLKDARFVGFPITGLTLDWYAGVLSDYGFLRAFAYSGFIAFSSTVLAMIVGTWIALFLDQDKLWGRTLLFGLVCLPAVIPGIISAISLRMFIRGIDLNPGTAAIILGHTIHAVPFVTLMIRTRLSTMPRSYVESAKDLGADEIIAFTRITLPYLKPALVGAMVFCVLLSFDDFVRTYFLSGYEATLPMLIFARLRSGLSPEINAMATIVLVVTAILGLYAERLTRRNRSR